MTEPRFLTVKDVAEALQVRDSTVHGLIKRGELRALQIGGRGIWRIGRDDLEAYIQGAYERAEQERAALPEDAEGEDGR
jgi:excisionase family DNA binding protein